MLKKEQKYFSVKTFTKTLFDAAYMMAKYSKYLMKVDKVFRSNIMMAVTNVNGCRICTYYHTAELLKAGANEEELKAILDDDYKKLDSHQNIALVFAQHYADTSGHYEKEAYQRVKDYYGNEMALGILASIKVIMFGNMNGISLGNLWDRIHFRKVSNAKFLTDLYNGIVAYPIMIVFIIINLFRKRILY
ncbi:MAG: carboxymuconolactone decarboxylase family protein [Candidatus Izemoplasmatales bacterium]